MFAPYRVLPAMAMVLIAAVPAMATISIDFDYTYDTGDFFAEGSVARDTLEAAGDFFEGILADDLDAITPGGNDRWTAYFTNPSTGTSTDIANLSIAADTLRIFVGARDLDGNAIGSAGPGGFGYPGGMSSSWRTTITTRGEGTTQGAGATDFGPWGGSLAIDNLVSWNLDHEASPAGGQLDLYSVVLHELTHVLGFGIADSWDNKVSSSQFTGTASTAEYGGNVPLEVDNAHWGSSVYSNVYPQGAWQSTLMSASISYGQRKHATELDVAALADIGWEIAPLPDPATVVGRHTFYNNSAFDTDDDAAAIATDKTALRPGETASRQHYTSYDAGINGIIIDVDSLFAPENLSLADFDFRVGNDNETEDWSLAPVPQIDVDVDGGAGGADRITLTWTDGAIVNRWLEVTIKANATTWLTGDDVFYFGNAVGETGNDPANALVTAADVVAVSRHPRGTANRADVANPFDVNRDMLVDATDVALTRGAVTSPFGALRLITPVAAPAPTPVPEPAGALTLLLSAGMALAVRPLRRR